MLFYLGNVSSYPLPLLQHWQHHSDWQFLSGLLIFTLLSFSKDRGLCSIHSLYRLFFWAACFAFAYAWLWGYEWLLIHKPEHFTESPFLTYVKTAFFVALALILIFINSLRQQAVFQPAILVTTVAWCLFNLGVWPISWSLTLIVLIVYYLLSVMVGSYYLAYRDELTGLPSRRALFQLSLSLGRKYTVAMMDIDHFKKFNDTYGHDIGDQVLRLVASKLAQVKIGGKVFRYGGEEFTIVFPRKSTEQVLHELERVRCLVADYAVVIRQKERQGKAARESKKTVQKSVSVTISIGVAQRSTKQRFDDVMKLADEKLYQAKKNGRNNVSY